MSTRSALFVSFLAWAVFLLLGSGNTQFFSSPGEAPTAPLPQLMPTPPNIHLDADVLLNAAHAAVDNLPWLACDVRQRRRQGDANWSSEASLQRGPNGCCRMEMTLQSGSSAASNIVFVSDGVVLAKVTATGATPKIESQALPSDPAARNGVLANSGCGGPAAVLDRARSGTSNWIAQPAALGDRPGLALTADLLATSDNDPKKLRLFLDAETLWLTRAQWWAGPPERGGVLMLELEFVNPRVNQPLSIDECARVFSYKNEQR